jgi:hypothetical protein
MYFLHPKFLYALAVLAIPVIIHLFHFRRYKRVVFSDIRFLKNIQEQTKSTRKLKEWLILMTRLLALSSLVFAFAQPFKGSMGNAMIETGQRVSIFIDNSLSMLSEGERGPLIEEAKQSAKILIESLPDGALFQLITHDQTYGSAKPLKAKEAIEKLAFIEPVYYSRNTEDLLALQKSWFAQAADAYHMSWWISDFQRSAYDFDAIEKDTSFNWQLLPLSSGKVLNISVDTAWIEEPYITAGTPITIKAVLAVYGGQNEQDIAVSLEVNGVKKVMTVVPKEGGVRQMVSMEITPEPGWNEAVVAIEDYPLSFDDKMFLAFYAAQSFDVLVVNAKTPNIYLNALYASDEMVKLEQVGINQFSFSNLDKYRLIILNEVIELSSGMQSMLEKYIAQGGFVYLIPGEDLRSANKLNPFLELISAPQFVSAHFGTIEVGTLSQTDLAFRGAFSKLPKNADLPKVDKYARLQANAGSRGYAVISLSNSDAYIWQTPFGEGRLYIQASPLQPMFTNFPKHALFVPLFLNLIQGSGNVSRTNYISGNNEDFYFASGSNWAGDKNVRFVPNTAQSSSWVMPTKVTNKGVAVNLFSESQPIGIYNLTGQMSNQLIAKVAFNYSRKESNPETYNMAELGIILPMANINSQQVELVAYKLKTQYSNVPLWRLFLLFAILFLLSEILIIRLIK